MIVEAQYANNLEHGFFRHINPDGSYMTGYYYMGSADGEFNSYNADGSLLKRFNCSDETMETLG